MVFKIGGSIFKKLQLFRSSFIFRMYSYAYHYLRPAGIYSLSINGYDLYVNSHDTGFVPSILRGNFERDETELFKNTVKPGMVVVDIGANIGYYTVFASKLVGPNGTVYAFEPEPRNYKLLIKNIKLNNCKNVIAVKKALSDKARTEILFLSPNNLGSHRMYRFKGASKGIPVKTVTFDSFFKDIKKIDLIKIDIEGSELKCLRGMKKTVGKLDMCSILTEFNPRMLKGGGADPIAFLKEILNMGFRIYKLCKSGKLSEVKNIKDEFSDVIAKNNYINLYCKKT